MIDHTRHMGIFDVGHLSVCLVGAGGIGAITAITLGKMGVKNILLFDDDDVDEVNIATQFHRCSDVRTHKVTAVSKLVAEFSDTVAMPYKMRIDEHRILSAADIYISAVDSIASRQGVWQAIKNLWDLVEPDRTRWYIDARMGAEVYEQFVVDLDRYRWYDRSINNASDEDIPDLPCTSKATIYTANIAAGHIGAAVRRIATGDQDPGFLTHDIMNNHLSFLDIGA